jgi:hypothetical protein
MFTAGRISRARRRRISGMLSPGVSFEALLEATRTEKMK